MSDVAPLKPVAEPAAGYNDLKYYFANLNTLFSIRGLLAADMMTAMPPGGMQRRLSDISSITKRIYAETTTSSVTTLLERVQNQAESNKADWNEWDLANLREMKRIHTHLAALPPDLYHAAVMTANEGRKRHIAALKNGNWNDIVPALQQSVDLYRRIGEMKQKAFSTATPYEALLCGYADDLTEEEISKLYDSLLEPLQKLYKQAIQKQETLPPPLALEGDFSRKDKMWLNQTVMQLMGFDFNRGSLSITSLSPMVSGTPDDVRVLVRCGDQHSFLDSLSDALYQGGRGLYLQGLPQNWKSQPVGQDLGSLINISISILYETIIGRTPQFFDFIASRAEGVFRAFSNKSFETENLYRLRKQLRTTSVRNNADEISKIFHDILRFRLERDLINGSLSVKDLPERWRALSVELLGIEPANLAEGPLQNPDWFTGRFGFIATNTFSHIVAAQLHETLFADMDALPDMVARGELGAIRHTLDKTIFSKGRAVDALQLVREITGQSPGIQPLLSHFERRYLSDKR